MTTLSDVATFVARVFSGTVIVFALWLLTAAFRRSVEQIEAAQTVLDDEPCDYTPKCDCPPCIELTCEQMWHAPTVEEGNR